MGLLNRIKASAQESSANKSEFFYTKDGEKKRIRMLCEIDDGFEVLFHSSYEKKINVPCQKQFGRDCPYCAYHEIADMKEKTHFVFPIYSQGDGKQQIMMEKACEHFSPIMPLIEKFEEYEEQRCEEYEEEHDEKCTDVGSIMDRDYIIEHIGKQLNKKIKVRGQRPCKMGQKITPWTKAEMMEKIDKAYPYKVQLDIVADEDDVDDNMPF